MGNPALKLDPPPFTPQTFLEWSEAREDRRYELVDGVPVEVEVGTYAHQKIIVNLVITIGNHINARDLPLAAVTEFDLVILPGLGEKLRIRRPDLTVLSGETPDAIREDAPVLLAEVTSPSNTMDYGNEKLREYARFPSLREFLEIAQSSPFVKIWRRSGPGPLVGGVVEGLEATVHLESLDLTLALADLYEGVTFPPRSDDTADAGA